jgi:hypothetical protein
MVQVLDPIAMCCGPRPVRSSAFDQPFSTQWEQITVINEQSIAAIDAARLAHGWTRPIYDTYNWSQIPTAMQYLLTGQGATGLPAAAYGDLPIGTTQNLIVLFVDAFGWAFFAPIMDRYPFLKRFAERGIVNKSTSMFPSTTTAHATLLYTGQVPIRSGFFEWFQYEPMVDNIVCPLMFNFAGESYPDTLRHVGLDPAKFYGTNSVYKNLNDGFGIEVTTYQEKQYTNTVYTTQNMGQGRLFGFDTLSEAITEITESVAAASAKPTRGPKQVHMLYIGTIDSEMHTYGPSSKHVAAEIDTVFTQLERLLHSGLEGRAKDTMVMLIADHGQVDIDPQSVVWVDDLPGADKAFTPFVRRNRADRLLVPAGSARDLFMYIEPDHLDEAHAWLAKQLDGRADVIRTADFIADGIFGHGPVDQRFLDRVANLLVLPHDEGIMWWHGDQPARYPLRGLHGGLHPAEMETPILFLPYV